MSKYNQGSLDYYRDLGKTQPAIADLVGMIDKQAAIIVRALEALTAAKKETGDR